MSLRTPAMKSIAALALVLPLSLAACGNHKEAEETAPSSTTTTTTKASTSAAPSSSEAAPSSEKSVEQKTSEHAATKDSAAEGDKNAKDAVNGAGDAAGQGAAAGNGEADAAAKETITNLINGTYQQQDVRSLAQYTRDNTCARRANEPRPVGPNGEQASLASLDLSQLDNLPADQQALLEPYNQQIRDTFAKTTTNIQDLQVNGNHATANVTVNSPAGSDNSTIAFENEGGTWKFC